MATIGTVFMVLIDTVKWFFTWFSDLLRDPVITRYPTGALKRETPVTVYFLQTVTLVVLVIFFSPEFAFAVAAVAKFYSFLKDLVA